MIVERQTIDILFGVGLIGGFWSVVSVVLGMIVKVVGDKFYLASMLEKLYLLNAFPNISNEKRKIVSGNHCCLRCKDKCDLWWACPFRSWSQWKDDKKLALSLYKRIEKIREDAIHNCITNAEDAGEDATLGTKEREHLVNSLLCRVGFTYGTKDVIKYFLYFIWCRRDKTLREISHFRKHWRLRQGHAKLQRELDIRRLLKSTRDVRVLRSSLFSRGEALLAKF